jgi:hypothetical protein
VTNPEEIWIPLVDEPLGSIVAELQRENPEIDNLVGTPHRLLAFKTFAYIRTGLVLGQLLFENDVPPYDGSETWVDALLRQPAHHERLAREVEAVAREIAADPKYADDERLGPDESAKARFLEFARRRRGEG